MTNYDILKEYEAHKTPVPTFEEWKQLKEYEQIVTSYNMKPIDYDIACETVNKLLDERKALKEQNAQLKEQINKCYLDAINRGTANAVKAVKEFGMPERIKELVEQNAQLKELLRIISSKTKICYSMVFQKDIISAELSEDLLKKINEVLK